MMGRMSKEWKPPKEDADVFAQYKTHVEEERKLKPEMEEAADRALASGATVGQLARHTGLTPEVFRRRARKLGVQHKRPPTVRPLRQEPAESTPVTATSPAPERVKPPGRLSVSPEVAALSYEQARDLFKDAETRHVQWAFRMRRTLGTVPPERRPYLGVQAGVDEGLIDLPERPERDEVYGTDKETTA